MDDKEGMTTGRRRKRARMMQLPRLPDRWGEDDCEDDLERVEEEVKEIQRVNDRKKKEQRHRSKRFATRGVTITIPDYFTKKKDKRMTEPSNQEEWFCEEEDWFTEMSDQCLEHPAVSGKKGPDEEGEQEDIKEAPGDDTIWSEGEGEEGLSKTMDAMLAKYREDVKEAPEDDTIWSEEDDEEGLSKTMDVMLADYKDQLDKGKEQGMASKSKDDLKDTPEAGSHQVSPRVPIRNQNARGQTPGLRDWSPPLPDNQEREDDNKEHENVPEKRGMPSTILKDGNLSVGWSTAQYNTLSGLSLVANEDYFVEAGSPRLASTPVPGGPRARTGSDGDDSPTAVGQLGHPLGGEDEMTSKETLVPSVCNLERGHNTNTGKNIFIPSINYACPVLPAALVSDSDAHHHDQSPLPSKEPLVTRLRRMEEDILPGQSGQMLGETGTVRTEEEDDKRLLEKKGDDCTYDEDGRCPEHGQGKKKFRPKKIWTKGKNGLFGWKTGRITYYTCKEDNPIPADRPTFLMLRGSAGSTRRKNVQLPAQGVTRGKTKPNVGRVATTVRKADEVGGLSGATIADRRPADDSRNL